MLKAYKYEKIESVLLEWFMQNQTLYIPIQGLVLRRKAEEIALKRNTIFTPSNRYSKK
jgi:hypothetical protein